MLLHLVFRLPSYDLLPLTVEISAVMTTLHLKQCLEASLPKHGHAVLLAESMRLVHRGRELQDDEVLHLSSLFSHPPSQACPHSSSSSPPPCTTTIEVIVKVCCARLSAPRLYDYAEFVRQVTPADGAKNVVIDAVIRLRLGCNAAGMSLHLESLVAARHSGDMVASLGQASARDRGFVQWTGAGKAVQQRVLLLEADPALFASRRLVDARRYWHSGVNGGYVGGDVHSWQRYTASPPVGARITLDGCWPSPGISDPAVPTTPITAPPNVDAASQFSAAAASAAACSIADDAAATHTVTLRPNEPLRPATLYALLLMNSVPTCPAGDCEAGWAAFRGAGIVAEDRLYTFTTAA